MFGNYIVFVLVQKVVGLILDLKMRENNLKVATVQIMQVYTTNVLSIELTSPA
jgi:hypothetical protein